MITDQLWLEVTKILTLANTSQIVRISMLTLVKYSDHVHIFLNI